MTQQNTTRATILATFTSHTLGEISELSQRFLSEGEGRTVKVDGDRGAVIGYFGPNDTGVRGSDGPSAPVREVDP